MANTLVTDLDWQPLSVIAGLLQLAADQLWDAADTSGIDSPLHYLALGSFFAASQAAAMLPVDHQALDYHAGGIRDPLQVLTVAKRLTLQLDPEMAGAGDLTVAVADLVRGARHSVA